MLPCQLIWRGPQPTDTRNETPAPALGYGGSPKATFGVGEVGGQQSVSRLLLAPNSGHLT